MTLPTEQQYKMALEDLVDQGELTVEQAVILLTVFRNHLQERPTQVRQLMAVTGLDWKRINWTLNGLCLRGAIKKLPENYYSL